MDYTVVNTGADAEEFGAAKVVAWHYQEIFCFSLLGELFGAAAGGLNEEVEGALGSNAVVAVGDEGVIQRDAVAIIGRKVGTDVHTPGDNLLLQ